jgi:hypothetical protein
MVNKGKPHHSFVYILYRKITNWMPTLLNRLKVRPKNRWWRQCTRRSKNCVCSGLERCTRWRSLLRHCTTSRNVAGSIPDGVTGIFY